MSKDPIVNNSGNSKVDVTINIDTTALAYFMGSYLHATKQLDDDEYFLMMRNLNTLTGKDNAQLNNLISNYKVSSHFKTIKSENNLDNVRIYY